METHDRIRTAALAVLVVLAACRGDDDQTGDATTTTAPPTTAPPTITATATTTTTVAAPNGGRRALDGGDGLGWPPGLAAVRGLGGIRANCWQRSRPVCAVAQIAPAGRPDPSALAAHLFVPCSSPLVAQPPPSSPSAAHRRDGNPGPHTNPPALFRVDTATSAVAPVALTPSLPPEYDVRDLGVIGGTTYAVLDATATFPSGEPVTAPDGSPLPRLLARADMATGAVITVPIDGFVVLEPDRVSVYQPDGQQRVADLTTLALVDPPAEAPIEGVTWRYEVDEAGRLSVGRTDPSSGLELVAGPVESGLPGDRVEWSSVFVGEDLMVVVTSSSLDEGQPSLTKLFRVGVRPG